MKNNKIVSAVGKNMIKREEKQKVWNRAINKQMICKIRRRGLR